MTDAMTARAIKKILLAGAAALAVFWGCSPNAAEREVQKAFREWEGPYVLYADKRAFTLSVYDRRLTLVARYRVAYGLNPDRGTKLYAGDNRTPEGMYRITEILSMDAQKDTPSYRKMRAINRVYFRARDGHSKFGRPDVDLGDNVYGPRYYALDFPRQRDLERYGKALERGEIPLRRGEPLPLGGGIAIHGNCDEASIGHPASSGCLRMYNNDIIELEKYIQIGTPVIISTW